MGILKKHKPFYSIQEVAGIFEVDEKLIRRECKMNRIQCVYLGDRVARIEKSELEKLIKNGIQFYAEKKKLRNISKTWKPNQKKPHRKKLRND